MSGDRFLENKCHCFQLLGFDNSNFKNRSWKCSRLSFLKSEVSNFNIGFDAFAVLNFEAFEAKCVSQHLFAQVRLTKKSDKNSHTYTSIDMHTRGFLSCHFLSCQFFSWLLSFTKHLVKITKSLVISTEISFKAANKSAKVAKIWVVLLSSGLITGI